MTPIHDVVTVLPDGRALAAGQDVHVLGRVGRWTFTGDLPGGDLSLTRGSETLKVPAAAVLRVHTLP